MVECYFYGGAWCLWGWVEKLFTLKSDFLERGGSIVKSDPGKKDILIKPHPWGRNPIANFFDQPQIFIIDYHYSWK
jgi:hypothetical protein